MLPVPQVIGVPSSVFAVGFVLTSRLADYFAAGKNYFIFFNNHVLGAFSPKLPPFYMSKNSGDTALREIVVGSK